MLRIIKLTIRNFKGIKAIEIEPESGKPVKIAGKNEAGKSSLFDGIESGLQGKKFHPEKPLRTGTKRGEVEIELGDDIVDVRAHRIFTPGNQRIEIDRIGIDRIGPKQEFLDSITDRRCFNPHAFDGMKPREQAEALAELLGLDFTTFDEDRETAFDKRRDVNRDLKRLEAELAAMPQPSAVDSIPEEPIQEELRQVNETVAANAAEKEKAASLQNTFDRAVENGKFKASEIEKLEDEITSMQALVERQRTELKHFRLGVKQTQEAANAQYALVEKLVDPDVSEITDRLAAAQTANRICAQIEQHDLKKGVVQSKRSESEGLTADIEAIDESKAATVAAADMPVEGLAFGEEGGITYHGEPWSQVSQGTRLKVSTLIGMRANPNVRVMLVDEGASLDAENRKLLCDVAAEHDYQLWMTTIEPDEDSIVIEDGRIVGQDLDGGGGGRQ